MSGGARAQALAALDRARSGVVWFTEQDFLITDPERFWASVEASRAQAMGFVEPESLRWHPA
ncbi:MAG: hypothetical protein VW339_00500, partial [Quisquiliibacterium sp.]